MAEGKNNIQEYQERIERYVLDEMSERERLDFEKEIAANTELRRQVALHTDMHTTLGNAEEMLLRKKFARAERDWRAQSTAAGKSAHDISPGASQSGRRIRMWKFASVAAVGLAFVAFAWWRFGTGEVQYAQAFSAYDMVLSQRAPADTAETSRIMNLAIQAYHNEDYATAAKRFGTLALQEPDTPLFAFYTAVSMIGAGQGAQSILTLKTLAQMNDHLLQEQSRWYLAVAWNQAGNTEKADSVLALIPIALKKQYNRE